MNNSSLLKQTIIAFSVRVFGALSLFIMNLAIARNLSIKDSGMFFLAFTVFIVLAELCTLGLPNAFIRHVAVYATREKWQVVKGLIVGGIGTSFVIALLISGMTFSFSFEISHFIFAEPGLNSLLSIIAFAVPCYVVYMLIGSAFMGLQKSAISVVVQNVSTQIVFLLVLLFTLWIGMELSVERVTKIFVLSVFVTCAYACYLWGSRTQTRVVADYSRKNDLVESAKPLYVMALINLLVLWSGQLCVGIFLESEQVALFSVAQRISMLTSLVLIAVNMVVAPRFAASANRGDNNELRSISLFCSRVMLLMAAPVLVLMMSFPSYFMGIFGEEYRQGAHLLQILAVGQFINVVTGSVGYLLNMTGHEKVMRNIVLVFGPLAILLSVLLTPLYGATGAAIATALVLSGQNLFAVLKVKKHLGFNTLKIL